MEGIIKTGEDFFGKFINVYFPNYFSWLSEKLSNFSPFFILSCAVGSIFVLAIYISFRNNNSL